MRTKILAVNAIIVAIVGLLSFVLMRTSLMSAASSPTVLLDEAKHNAEGAAAQLELDGLKVERWLTVKAAEPAAMDALNKADPSAAGDSATALCDSLVAAAKSAPDFQGNVPSIVLLVDASGKIVGRNNSPLLRGDDIGKAYPTYQAAVSKGQSGSDVWINKSRNDQFLASYAPVRNDKGQVVGSIVVGIQINDELSRVADTITGRPVVIASGEKGAVSVLARSGASTTALDDAVTKAAADKGARDTVIAVIDKGHVDAAPATDMMVGAAPLDLGDGKGKAIVTSAPGTVIPDAGSLATPLLGVMALGIILVAIGAWLLGNYISGPIATLEEGLLAIINGQQDKRFQLEHAELGGLAFRIDQLLNQLLGVEEDTTDDEGRVSRAPSAAAMASAVAVDDQGGPAAALDPAAVQALAAEPADQYYGRIYQEYIAAKKSLGEQTDHITPQAFQGRLQSMESDAMQKHGKPVRYQVQTRGREVILVAVPVG